MPAIRTREPEALGCCYPAGHRYLEARPRREHQGQTPQGRPAGGQRRNGNDFFYGFVAPGHTHIPPSRGEVAGDFTDVALGGGLDYFFSPRFSFGGEIATTFYRRKLPSQRRVTPVAWVQFNGAFHFNSGDATKRFVPFISIGGLGASFADSGLNEGWNYGGGVHLWGKGRFGARLEFRRVILPVSIEAHSGGRFTTIRLGLAFR